MGSEERLERLGLAHLADNPEALQAALKERISSHEARVQAAEEARAKDPAVQHRARIHKILMEARIRAQEAMEAKEAEEAKQLSLENK